MRRWTSCDSQRNPVAFTPLDALYTQRMQVSFTPNDLHTQILPGTTIILTSEAKTVSYIYIGILIFSLVSQKGTKHFHVPGGFLLQLIVIFGFLWIYQILYLQFYIQNTFGSTFSCIFALLLLVLQILAFLQLQLILAFLLLLLLLLLLWRWVDLYITINVNNFIINNKKTFNEEKSP